MSNIKNAEKMIVKILRLGVTISVLFILSGMIMLFVTGNDFYNINNISLGMVMNGVINFQPSCIIMFGLLILIITPILRVLISIIVFKKEGDTIYVKITCVVMAVLIFSFIIGKIY